MFPLRDDIPSRLTPWVNYALIAANAAVFLRELSLGRQLKGFIYQFGMVPAAWSASLLGDANLTEKALPLLTSMFIHGGLMHVLSNMWMLYIFGDNVEDRLGHFRFLLFYLVSGLGAGLIHLFTNWGSTIPTIGASGAIAGVMGGYVVLFPHARVLTLVPLGYFLQTVNIPAVFFLGIWFLSQLYSGVMTLGAQFGGIAWWAHIGGFGVGVVLIRLILPKKAGYGR